MADIFTIVGMPALDYVYNNKKICKLSEIYKQVGKTFKKRNIAQLEKCKKIKTMEH